jgi:hypothetical protein
MVGAPRLELGTSYDQSTEKNAICLARLALNWVIDTVLTLVCQELGPSSPAVFNRRY